MTTVSGGNAEADDAGEGQNNTDAGDCCYRSHSPNIATDTAQVCENTAGIHNNNRGQVYEYPPGIMLSGGYGVETIEPQSPSEYVCKVEQQRLAQQYGPGWSFWGRGGSGSGSRSSKTSGSSTPDAKPSFKGTGSGQGTSTHSGPASAKGPTTSASGPPPRATGNPGPAPSGGRATVTAGTRHGSSSEQDLDEINAIKANAQARRASAKSETPAQAKGMPDYDPAVEGELDTDSWGWTPQQVADAAAARAAATKTAGDGGNGKPDPATATSGGGAGAKPPIQAPPNAGFPWDWHHLLPRELAEWFEQKGINIHDHCVHLPSDIHRGKLHGGKGFGKGGRWNKEWKDYKDENPRATQEEIFQKMREMMEKHGVNGPVQPHPTLK